MDDSNGAMFVVCKSFVGKESGIEYSAEAESAVKDSVKEEWVLDDSVEIPLYNAITVMLKTQVTLTFSSFTIQWTRCIP